MLFGNKDKMGLHYSVRQSNAVPYKWKVVIAGNGKAYSDLDLPLFDSFERHWKSQIL